MSKEANTVEELWKAVEDKLTSNKEPYQSLNAIYEIQLSDADDAVHQIHFKNGSATVYDKGELEADCILQMKVNYFNKFLRGDLNSTTAFMTGKLKVNGNIGLALKLENVLKEYDFSA